MKNLLFVTWDSDQTNYLENLFFPILAGLRVKGGFECAVLQFSWAAEGEVARIGALAADLGIQYTHHPIMRKPHPVLGTLLTLWKGSGFLKGYLEENPTHILMPRSTMPALMVNRIHSWINSQGIKLVFDADGLPLEERADFAGLRRSSYQYRLLKKQETKLLLQADKILTRSQKAIDIHVGNIGEVHRHKFAKVSNGRHPGFFTFNAAARARIREEYGLLDGDRLFVYTGTLGPQYAWEEMLDVFESYRQAHAGSEWLLLSQSTDFLKGRIPAHLKDAIHLLQVPFSEMPAYLSAADVAFSLRIPVPSMAGIAPIKLGEYLLMGLPTIASTGIGDGDSLVSVFPGSIHPYNHSKASRLPKALRWLSDLPEKDRSRIREKAVLCFGLDGSVKEYVEALGFTTD